MEFLIILLMLAVAFYFIIIAPALGSQKSRYTADRGNTSAANRHNRQTERPKVCPLWGIEISHAQQRRLGKDDPSVIAAKLYRQQLGKFASFQQTRPEILADPSRPSNSATLPRFLQDLLADESSSASRRTSRPSPHRNSPFSYTRQNPLKSAPAQTRSSASRPY